MKLALATSNRLRRATRRAFTLVEMMITVMVFVFVISGMVYTQIFAMRVYTLSATKLNAATGARQALNSMRDEIRSAKIVLVGTYAPGANAYFIQAPINTPQVGNALALSRLHGLIWSSAAAHPFWRRQTGVTAGIAATERPSMAHEPAAAASG